MGCSMSLKRSGNSTPLLPPSAKVVSLNGALREYPVPVKVVQVLQQEASSSSSNNLVASSSLFLCNSDSLFYDECVPALDAEEKLVANQIYFVLSASKLGKRLTAADMAALAIKASAALQNAARENRRHKKGRISPVIISHDHVADVDVVYESAAVKTFGKPKPLPYSQLQQLPGKVSRSGSVRRFQRYTSRRAKLAARSFKLKLSTIYEGIALQP